MLISHEIFDAILAREKVSLKPGRHIVIMIVSTVKPGSIKVPMHRNF